MTTTKIRYEPFEQAGRDRLFETYEVLRNEYPVHRTDSGYWVVSRYADIKRILLSPEKFSSAAQQDEMYGMSTQLDEDADPAALKRLGAIMTACPVDMSEMLTSRVIVAADAPQHTRIRRIVVRGFTPRRVAQLDEQITGIVAEQLAGIESAQEWDAVHELGEPLPMHVIGNILGVPPRDRHKILHWSEQSTDAALGEHRGTLAAQEMLAEVLREFSEYFVGVIESRRTDPTDDLISALVRAEEAETLTTVEAVMFLLSLMEGGLETTTSSVGNMVKAFIDHPDQLQILLENPDLASNAVEEIGRYRSPIQYFFRRATGDQEVAGVTIPDGQTVLVLAGAANTDPRQFGETANSFDIRRDISSVLTFGTGPHRCLGVAFARLMLRNALTALAPHLSRFELSAEPLKLQKTFHAYGYERLLLKAR
jgi:cytochrome P450